MNVSQLKEILDNVSDETEVRLMSQANYPFEYSVEWAVGLDEIQDFQASEPDEDEAIELFQPASGNDPGYFGSGPWCGDGILYLVEGQQLGYGTSDAWVVAKG